MELFPYQREGVALLTERRRQILGDEMGLGKTIQALYAIDNLNCADNLIVVGVKVALGVWKYAISDEFGDKYKVHVYHGTPEKRKRIWGEYTQSPRPRFLLVTAPLMNEVHKLQYGWDAMVIDEYHRMGLCNRKTERFDSVTKFKQTNLFLLSGSPIKQGVQDLWAPLHLLDPIKFKSYWGFVNTYCTYSVTPFGRTIDRLPKDTSVMRDLLGRYVVRRLKKNVAPQLPPKFRNRYPLDMSTVQRKLYQQLEDDMVATYGDELERVLALTPNVITQVLRQRQLLVTPQLLGHHDKGAALEALPLLIEEAFESGTSVVVFTPFREALKFIHAEVADHIEHKAYFISGALRNKADAASIARQYQDEPDTFKVLYCTIQSGISFTAHAASVAFFVGADWDAETNKQAEDRLHRLGQKAETVNYYYLHYPGTVEDDVLQYFAEKDKAARVILSDS